MCKVKFLFLFAVATIIVMQCVQARPYRTLSRQKRISDQRLAELETLIALSRMKNKMVTIPVGFGRVDPLKIGRRKRYVEELFKQLLSDVTSGEDGRKEVESEEAGNRGRIEVEEEDVDTGKELQVDDSERISGYRHLPVWLPE